jgi:hypothetical protein
VLYRNYKYVSIIVILVRTQSKSSTHDSDIDHNGHDKTEAKEVLPKPCVGFLPEFYFRNFAFYSWQNS